MNGVAVFLLRFELLDAIALIIMGSQKSAPVAVTVITYITPVVGIQGLLAIPCIIGQLSQIFIGSILAKFFVEKVDVHQQRHSNNDSVAT
jgi:sodium/bile acid cotransporter 7